MKKVLLIGGIATLVAILGVAVLGAATFAQEGEEGPFNFRERFREVVAEILGIPVSDYTQALEQAGEQVLSEAVTEGWLTEEQAERMQERIEKGGFPGKMGPHGIFPRGGRGGMWAGPHGQPLEAVASALDMTAEELRAELQEGKSIAALAEEKGVALDAIVDACVEQMSERLAQAVEEGKMTQKQMDWMLEQARERIQGMLDQTWDEGGCGPGPGGRPGRFKGLPGQNDA